MGNLGRDKQHRRSVLACRNAGSASDALSRVHREIRVFLGYRDRVGVRRTAGSDRDESARLLDASRSQAIGSQRELEALMAEDAAAGRPFRAALCEGKLRGGLPAPGFFEAAQRLGRFSGPFDGPEAEAFVACERRALFASYSEHS
jgi:hypothetical protein